MKELPHQKCHTQKTTPTSIIQKMINILFVIKSKRNFVF
jgi:hypothetical protein